MKISARIPIEGRVTKITAVCRDTVVEIGTLEGNPTITAVITNDAVSELELAEGAAACA
jgi:molybdopterin-binding protein